MMQAPSVTAPPHRRAASPRRAVAMLTALLAGLIGGCQQRTSDKDLRPIEWDVVAAVVERPADAAAPAGLRDPVILLDVRRPEAFEAGHLPTAVNIHMPRLRSRDPRLMGRGSIIVYGESGEDSLAPAAAKKLIDLAYPRVRLFRGGVEQWRLRGRPLAQLTEDPTDTDAPQPDAPNSP